MQQQIFKEPEKSKTLKFQNLLKGLGENIGEGMNIANGIFNDGKELLKKVRKVANDKVKDFLDNVEHISAVVDEYVNSIGNGSITIDEVQKTLEWIRKEVPPTIEFQIRNEIISKYLKKKGLDNYLDVSSFNSISENNNLNLVEGINIFQLLKNSNYPKCNLSTLSKQDYSTLKLWNIQTLGNVPDLTSFKQWVTLVDYKRIKQTINCSFGDIYDVLQILYKCDFPKYDLFNLETEDFDALLECKKLEGNKYQTAYDMFNDMPILLRKRLGVWLEKSYALVDVNSSPDTENIGEILHYSTKLSSKPLPDKIKYTLHLLRIVIFYYTGVDLPKPRIIYLVAIWLVMLSFMTRYAKFSDFELGATLIVIIAHIIKYALNENQITDISKLLTSEVKGWSDLSNGTLCFLSNDNKDMIEAWIQTLKILVDVKQFDISNGSRVLLTYSIGTSYMRYISRPFDIKALINGISPMPTRYSLHNVIKLFRSDDEYEKCLKYNNINSMSIDEKKLKLAFAPYSNKGRRGDFCNISTSVSTHYYPSALSDIYKRKIKANVTSVLSSNAPFYSGMIIYGMLDTEDVFAEEGALKGGHRISVKNNERIKRYACLSADCYGKEPINIMGCEVIEKKQSINDLRAVLYSYGGNDIICAFAGTISKKDVKNDILQPFGISPQYADALKYGREICNRFPQKNITFVGHSMGGGEAAYCAIACQKEAYTFNPAGLGEITLSDLNLKNKSYKDLHKIHAYIFRGDVLNIFQDVCEGLGLLDIRADGMRYDVYDYKPERFSVDDLHGMNGILNYFGVNRHPKFANFHVHYTNSSINVSPGVKDGNELEMIVNGIDRSNFNCVILKCYINKGCVKKEDRVYLYRDDGALVMANIVKSIFINKIEYKSASVGQTVYIKFTDSINNILQCVKIKNHHILSHCNH